MGTVDLKGDPSTTAPTLLHKFWGIVLYTVDCLGLTGQCLS